VPLTWTRTLNHWPSAGLALRIGVAQLFHLVTSRVRCADGIEPPCARSVVPGRSSVPAMYPAFNSHAHSPLRPRSARRLRRPVQQAADYQSQISRHTDSSWRGEEDNGAARLVLHQGSPIGDREHAAVGSATLLPTERSRPPCPTAELSSELRRKAKRSTRVGGGLMQEKSAG
jgi:hypothetical protein